MCVCVCVCVYHEVRFNSLALFGVRLDPLVLGICAILALLLTGTLSPWVVLA